MPGLIGFVKQLCPYLNQKILTEMAAALEPEDRFQVDFYHGEGFGFGRVSLGIANPEPQPIWNENKTLCIFMEGEIYDYAASKQNLTERGYRFGLNNDAEFILHLYEEFGEDFALQLNGTFIIIIWDEIKKRLLVVNDRLGTYPFYYAQVNGGLVIGSGLRALIADRELPRTVNYNAISQVLTFDHLLNNNTLLKDVHLYPQGSLLTYQDNQLDIRQYWPLRFPESYENQSEDYYLEQLIYYLRQAVVRQQPGNYSAGVMLSGGLDSRFLLALLQNDANAKPMNTFTWGIPGCDDARYAKELAKKLNSQHYFYELKPDWLLHLAEKAVRITDGMANAINLHALATLEDEARHAQIIYKGFLGDAMLGYALQPPFWGSYSPEIERDIHLGVHQNQGVITFDPSKQKNLFTDAFQQRLDVDVMDTYHRAMLRSGSSMLAIQRLYFDYTQRVPRLTLSGVDMVRDRTIVRLPFCDNDFVDFARSVPPGYLYQRQLYKNAFIRAYPDLAKIPNTENGFPMITCARDVLLRSNQILGFHLQKVGLGRLIKTEHRPYKDYTTWFRTVLRPWVEETLLSKQSLGRGYFKTGVIQQIVTEHMNGANHTLKLGAFLTLELWHKRYID